MNAVIDTSAWPATKQKLVDASVHLMRTTGFDATTLDDICESAKVTKGALFHYFDSKNEVAMAALERFAEGKTAEFAGAPFRKLADPLQRVLGRLDFVIDSASSTKVTRGCLIGMLAQEISFREPELRKECQELFSRVAEDFRTDLAAAKAAYAAGAGFDPKNLATFYVSMIQGSLLVAKASNSNRVLIENVKQFRSMIELLFANTSRKSAKSASE